MSVSIVLLLIVVGHLAELGDVVVGALDKGGIDLLIHELTALLEVGHDDLLKGVAIRVDHAGVHAARERLTQRVHDALGAHQLAQRVLESGLDGAHLLAEVARQLLAHRLEHALLHARLHGAGQLGAYERVHLRHELAAHVGVDAGRYLLR